MHWGIFEALLFGLSAIAGFMYLAAAYRQHSRKSGWSSWRTASFLGGILVMLIAVLPQTAVFAHHDLRGHMLQHLLLGMIAPLGLVLGAPVLLLLRSSPTDFSRLVVRVLRSRLVGFISHPFTALLLNIGGMYCLYLTPLYQHMLQSPLLHALIHWHFLAAGCLFTWSIIGPEPVAHRTRWSFRLAVAFISMATHAFLSKAMYAYGFPDGSGQSLQTLQSAAKIMYYGGDLAELLLVIALFSQLPPVTTNPFPLSPSKGRSPHRSP